MAYKVKTLTSINAKQTGKFVAEQLNKHQQEGLVNFLVNSGIHVAPIPNHKTLASISIWDEGGFPIISINQDLNKVRQAWEIIAQLNWLVSQSLWSLPKYYGKNTIKHNELLYSRTIVTKDTDYLINQATIYAFMPNKKVDNYTKNQLAQRLGVLCNVNAAKLIKNQQEEI